ncbi:MAG: TrkH family potassium uptake protein [Candidatus Limivicinus sp.]|jgi:trk system potassium uptake protein TrkH
MNYRMIFRVLGILLRCLAVLMLLPVVCGLCYRESVIHFLITIAVTAAAGICLGAIKPRNRDIYAREGFVIVGLGWIIMSMFSALPFVIGGSIPNYIDAFFETVSGFTTTGATILTDVETLPRCDLFWRSFTHWIGGMGVLVFIMAVMPMSGEYSMHIMRAEVPGPSVGKLVPRARKTASILYLMYVGLTVIEVILLLCGGMSFFDALLHSFATAGTGGFSTRNASIGAFHSPYIEVVCGTFMLLFGLNFNLYFLLLIGRWRDVLKNEELRWYVGIVSASVLAIALGIAHTCKNFGEALRYSYFNVATVISTTGFCNVDFNEWPSFCKCILMLLMMTGACAGSTGGGLKISRVAMLLKTGAREVKHILRPRSVVRVQFDGERVDTGTLRAVTAFYIIFIMLLLTSTFLVSFDGYDFETNFTASLSCMSNIGPGLSLVGPTGNFSIFSYPSKIILSFTMLLGRLEIFPILVLFSRHTWKK